MKSFREQFIKCEDEGLLNKTKFFSFKKHPEMLPAFPGQKFFEAIKSGKAKGIHKFLCGRFGGICSSGHKECQKLRKSAD